MTQINTPFSNRNIFRDFFGENSCESYSMEHEKEIADNVFGYLTLKKCDKELQSIPTYIHSYASLNMYNLSDRIEGCLKEVINSNNYSIIVFRGLVNSKENVTNSGYEEQNTASCPLNQFLSTKDNPARVFVRKTGNDIPQVVIFVREINISLVDKLFSCIPRLFPSWYAEQGVPDDEYELFKALASSDYKAIEKIVNEKCAEFNFREKLILKTFEGYENILLESEKQRLNSTLEMIQSNYQECVESLREILEELQKAQLAYDSLCNFKQEKKSTSFANFLITHKNIDCKKYDLQRIRYVIDETIEYFDQDRFEDYYNNEDCSFMIASSQKTKIILKGLFLRQYGKLRVLSEFECCELNSIRPLCFNTIRGVSYNNHFIHPHLGRYQCLGANELPIAQCLKEGNWDLAIEQTVAATKNINFGDAIVMQRFVQDINNRIDSEDKGKYIIADNGQYMTLEEFVQYVEQLEKEKEKENSEEIKQNEQTNQTNE